MIMNLLAWDPIDKKMGVVETYHPKTGKVMFENDSWDWYKRDRIIRRPTGLKDKNGKEIYEGDIIEEYEEGRWLWVVVWNETYGCWFIHAPIQGEHFNTSDMEIVFKNGEIIGNIYVNPTLLEEASVQND